MSTDQLVKTKLLRAPRHRVWTALTDSAQFGSWFGVKFEGPFVAGNVMIGVIVPTTVDPDIAKAQKPLEGTQFEFIVDRIEPEVLFSFRWHPYAIDPSVDYSAEPRTLVKFTLEDADGGILLTVTESGFEGIDLSRRAKAFEMNAGGWAAQMSLIEKYLVMEAGQ